MSLVTNVTNLATRIATEFKALRTIISGSGTGDGSGLTTTSKNLIGAINEVKQTADSAADATIDNLGDIGDVTITTPSSGDVIVYDGTVFKNGNLDAKYQPLDSDLTAIAGMTTTAYGRGFLSLAAQGNLMALLSGATEAEKGVVELATTAEATTGTDTSRAVTPAGVKAALNALVAGAPGALDTLNELAAAIGDDADFAGSVTSALSGKQPLDPTLTALAGLTTAANKMIYATAADTFATTDLGAFGKTFLATANAAAGLSALGAASSSNVGDTAHNFVTDFEGALV